MIYVDTREKALVASAVIIGAVAESINASAASGGYNTCTAYRY